MNKPHTNCRVCNSEKMTKYFDAGELPLANNNATTKEESLNAPRYPLQLMFCEDCGLSQLSIVADPVEMFSNYDYRSAVNKGYVDHCREMAQELELKYGFNHNIFHIDIAGNDGTLLKVFRSVMMHKVLNIDPAENLTAIAEMDGIPSITDFWGTALVDKIKSMSTESSHFEKADLITATNVFAHVDDVNDFLKACQMALSDDGIIVLEFPYLIDFIEKYEFDTIYHEHLSYFNISPLMILCEKNDLQIIEVKELKIHGGSRRIIIAHKNDHKHGKPANFGYHEFVYGYGEVQRYLDWGEEVFHRANHFRNAIIAMQATQSPKISAFAASAKGNTLLNYTGLNHKYINYIVDETPEKIGKYYAGTGIKIVNKSELITNPPYFLIILSWNFKDEIIDKCRKLGYKGKFIIPIPEFTIVE